MKTQSQIMADCPSCGEGVIFIKPPVIGQFISCRYCDDRLEVIDLDPILLDWPLTEDDLDYDDVLFDEV
jgi:hypothetical protein